MNKTNGPQAVGEKPCVCGQHGEAAQDAREWQAVRMSQIELRAPMGGEKRELTVTPVRPTWHLAGTG